MSLEQYELGDTLDRYDVIMEPKDGKGDAYVFEFKVKDPDSETTLEETVQSALAQIKRDLRRTNPLLRLCIRREEDSDRVKENYSTKNMEKFPLNWTKI